jgi:dTDP-4-amino-4,6-dideoxygalactose transaminase
MVLSMLKVPFVDLAVQYQEIRDRLLVGIDKVGNSGQYVLGEECLLLEEELKVFCDSKHVVTVGNGSDALFLVLKALGIGPGDEVITAPNSFIASAWAISATGATPKYCDVDDGFNMDPQELRRSINKKTKAIIPVHLAGIPCRINEITEVAKIYGINIIEDCAQALGATFQNRHVGNFGVAGGFSMHPLKNLGVMGDGGFITTNNEELSTQIRLLRNHGLKDRDHVAIWGYNSRLDELQALVGRIKLKLLKEWNGQTLAIANKYLDSFSGKVEVLKVPMFSKPVWHNFLIFTERRDSLRKYLFDKGIDTRIHYPIPIHLQEVHKNQYRIGDYPKAEYQSANSLSLPIYPTLTNNQVEYVIDTVLEFLK